MLIMLCCFLLCYVMLCYAMPCHVMYLLKCLSMDGFIYIYICTSPSKSICICIWRLNLDPAAWSVYPASGSSRHGACKCRRQHFYLGAGSSYLKDHVLCTVYYITCISCICIYYVYIYTYISYTYKHVSIYIMYIYIYVHISCFALLLGVGMQESELAKMSSGCETTSSAGGWLDCPGARCPRRGSSARSATSFDACSAEDATTNQFCSSGAQRQWQGQVRKKRTALGPLWVLNSCPNALMLGFCKKTLNAVPFFFLSQWENFKLSLLSHLVL